MKFEVVCSENFFAVKFHLSSGVLEVPKLIIDSNFETSKRNLMACEQCQHNEVSIICDYAKFNGRFYQQCKGRRFACQVWNYY